MEGREVQALRAAKGAGWRVLLAASALVCSLAILVLVWKWGGPTVAVGSAVAAATDAKQDSEIALLRGIASDTRVALVEINASLKQLADIPERVRAIEIRLGGK